MPVFNEQKHLAAAIDSIINQTYSDFKLLISNNWSTDNSDLIIEGYQDDKRITKIVPSRHLSSMDHVEWIDEYIKNNFTDFEYLIFIGGHDIWSPDYLKTLISGMNENPNAAIVYTDSYEIDDENIIINKHNGYIITTEIIKPLRPLHVLVGLTHNMVFGGLWRQSIRSNITARKCMGADHLLIAEASLLGDVVYKYGAHIGLRIAGGAGDWGVYIKKHLGLNNIESRHGILDFKNQLNWVISIQEKAVRGNSFYEQPIIYDSLLCALINGYINRYYNHLIAFGSIDEFINTPEIKISNNLLSECARKYKAFSNCN